MPLETVCKDSAQGWLGASGSGHQLESTDADLLLVKAQLHYELFVEILQKKVFLVVGFVLETVLDHTQ